MPIITILVVLIIIGVLVYVINSVIPMDPRFKIIVNALIVIVALLWILDEFGLMHMRLR